MTTDLTDIYTALEALGDTDDDLDALIGLSLDIGARINELTRSRHHRIVAGLVDAAKAIDRYPYPVSDGVAACWACAGEAAGCASCGGEGFLTVAEIVAGNVQPTS